MDYADMQYLQDKFGKELFPSHKVITRERKPILGLVLICVLAIIGTVCLVLYFGAVGLLFLLVVVPGLLEQKHYKPSKHESVKYDFNIDDNVYSLISISKELDYAEEHEYIYNVQDEKTFRMITWDNVKARQLLNSHRIFKSLMVNVRNKKYEQSKELTRLQKCENESVRVAASTLSTRSDDTFVITYKYLDNTLTLTYSMQDFGSEVVK